ncbi:hypothetical protein [Haliangium sp.]|uniref:hypothetical protein n=1 Tax=Haliangium sp. TaxID=2663208 RepID=UPI003D0F80C6
MRPPAPHIRLTPLLAALTTAVLAPAAARAQTPAVPTPAAAAVETSDTPSAADEAGAADAAGAVEDDAIDDTAGMAVTTAEAPRIGQRYHLALIPLAAPADHEKAAALVIEILRHKLGDEARFELADAAAVERARAQHGAPGQPLTFAQACTIGRELQVPRVVIVGGYQVHESTTSGAPRPKLPKDGIIIMDEALDFDGRATAKIKRSVRVTGHILIMATDTCAVERQSEFDADYATLLEDPGQAMHEARREFSEAVDRGLRDLFPMRTTITTVSRYGGVVVGGTVHGIQAGQYYEVIRDERLIGHVYVDKADDASAEVSLVRGAPALDAGDFLSEAGTVRVWELAFHGTPNFLDQRGGSSSFGVAAAARVELSQPVSASTYGFVVEHLRADDLTRWRAGIEYGYQLRLIPRRLFAYGRVGAGLLLASQPLYDPETGQEVDGASARGFEFLNGVGVKAAFGDGLTLHLDAGFPLAFRDRHWALDSDRKKTAPAEMRTYDRPQSSWPTVSLGLGWRFP